ncbi:MAG TPA: TauD/TfdA family dioxygenase [Anaerolineae bacterium]
MRIHSYSLGSDALEIHWENGRSNQYHYVWLRDNCPTARHPVVGERTLDPVAIPLDIAPADVKVAEDASLHVTWANDGHQSHYSPVWLYQNAYEPEARVERRFKPTLWSTEMLADYLPEVTYESIVADDEGLLTWLRLLRQYGFTIVRGVPTEPGMVLKVAERISYLRNTNFGILFNVESMPDPNSLAYTAVKLNAHTDLVSREAQPGLQFLHCLVFDAEGGESILVDGFAAAEELKRRHPDDYEILTTVPVRFRYQDKETDINFKSPVIRLDADGDYFEIRYSTALLAPLDIDPSLVKPFYKAFQNFSRILRDPRYEFKFKLQPGDCEVFDNRRVLHGRDEFNPQSGPRHLQGCYVDTDDFLSRLRVLERQGRDFRESLSIVRQI